MQRLIKVCRLVISLFFCVVMLVIILSALMAVGGGGGFQRFGGYWILLGGIVFAGIVVLLYKLLQRVSWHLPKWLEVIIVVFIMLLVLGLQIFTVKTSGVAKTWDAGELDGAVNSLVTNGTLEEGWHSDYWSYFPFQYFLLKASVGIVQAVHAVGINLPTSTILSGLNIVLVNLSILLVYLCLRKLLNRRAALLGLLLSVLCTPIILYSNIYYSDTTSMFFIILGFYLLLWIFDQEISLKKRLVLSFLFGVVMFVAMQIKMTAIILLIASIIYLLLRKRGKKKKNLKSVLACGAVFLLAFVGLNGVWKVSTANDLNHDLALPLTNWIEMGIKGRGEFHIEVTNNNLAAVRAGEDADALAKEEIAQQLMTYGVGGYTIFLVDKIAYTWGDGSLYVSNKLAREPLHPDSVITKVVAEGKEYNVAYRVIANIVWCGILVLLLIGGIKTWREWDVYTILKLSLMGVFIFFLFWETRSRYLLNYVPLFIILATYAATRLTVTRDSDKIKA